MKLLFNHRSTGHPSKDEYGVYRYEHGYAQVVDGSAILVSKEDI
uniref:Uncharacterized protein n=1 Tax=Brassica oleracea TaxID=3712 RepID=A0A3P6EXT5_BRAOL|nr:unnamed protein product [Brassica oleracea]